MTNDFLQTFMSASPSQQLEMAQNVDHLKMIQAHFGEDVANLFNSLTKRSFNGHLARETAPNLLFVPGVTGSLLLSEGLGGVWWIDVRTRNQIDKLSLRPDGQSDADSSFRISSVGIDISYIEFFAGVIETTDFGLVHCHYDWRKPVRVTAHRIKDEVIKAQQSNGGKRVHIVAHSMGGILVRESLRQYPELWDKIGRIVFIGTPHYGSPSISWYLKDHLKGFDLMALLGLYLSRSTFRSLWGVLSLLPAPAGIYPGTRPTDRNPWTGNAGDSYVHACANFNLYDAEAWKLDLNEGELKHLQDALDDAARSHKELAEWHGKLDQAQRDRMAIIAGVGYETLFRTAYTHDWLWTSMEKITSRIPGDVHREGDGRVPLASALLEHVGQTRFVRAEHGTMPMAPAVYSDAFRFLRGEHMQLPRSPAGALQPHLSIDGLANHLPPVYAARVKTSGEDPGYLDFNTPSSAVMRDLDARIEMMPDFLRLRLL